MSIYRVNAKEACPKCSRPAPVVSGLSFNNLFEGHQATVETKITASCPCGMKLTITQDFNTLYTEDSVQ